MNFMDFTPLEEAFSRATERAPGEISVAIIEALGNSVAKAMDIAPLPVPISNMNGDESGGKSVRAASMRVSVWGRGIITAGLTLKRRDQNSFCPIM